MVKSRHILYFEIPSKDNFDYPAPQLCNPQGHGRSIDGLSQPPSEWEVVACREQSKPGRLQNPVHMHQGLPPHLRAVQDGRGYCQTCPPTYCQ